MQVANECSYSYKLGQKNEFKFWCKLGWFLHGQSHIAVVHRLAGYTAAEFGYFYNLCTEI